MLIGDDRPSPVLGRGEGVRGMTVSIVDTHRSFHFT
jgi:hypothetical protein